jgi:hypothetical protein
MIQVQVCERQHRPDYNNIPLLKKKKKSRAKNEKLCTVSYFVMVLLEDDSNNFHTYRTYEFVKTSNTFFSLIVMLHESLYPN